MRVVNKGICLMIVLLLAGLLGAQARTTSHPDFKDIQERTLDPESQYYYPKLLKSFLSNDTTMTEDDYHYFYYGTMFQEDYNPYRPNPYASEVSKTEPLYYKHGTLSRSEKTQIQNVAEKSLASNPINLKQLSYLVYAYEQLGKHNLAKIWKHKLNNIILVISHSGTGADKEHAWVIVDPQNEFDYFNLSGANVESQDYEPPYYERVTVRPPGATDTRQYWFDLHHILEQYYRKHPSER